MALDKDDIKQQYPLPAYNYRVAIAEETYSFSEVSGLAIEYDTMSYRHGLSYREGVIHQPGIQQDVTLTLQRGVVSSQSKLLQWISSVRLDTVDRKDVSIQLCDEQGQPLVIWTAIAAFPTKLEAPNFSAESSDIAIESITLLATGLRISYPNAS